MKRMIFKVDGINGLPNTPSGYKYLGYDGESLADKSGATVSGISTNTSLVYRALLTQTGTASPVATVLENTLGSVSSTYTSEGLYSITSSALFTSDKTMVMIGDVNAVSFITSYWSTSSDIPISTKSFVFGAFNSVNGILAKTPIEIRVYL
jgi:hypothetical protein